MQTTRSAFRARPVPSAKLASARLVRRHLSRRLPFVTAQVYSGTQIRMGGSWVCQVLVIRDLRPRRALLPVIEPVAKRVGWSTTLRTRMGHRTGAGKASSARLVLPRTVYMGHPQRVKHVVEEKDLIQRQLLVSRAPAIPFPMMAHAAMRVVLALLLTRKRHAVTTSR